MGPGMGSGAWAQACEEGWEMCFLFQTGSQAVIKAAASAAFSKTKIQGGLDVSVARQPSRRPLAPLDSWILVFGEAALAADLTTA